MNKKKLVISALHSKTGGGLTYINALLYEFAKQHDYHVTVLRHKDYASLINTHDNISYIDVPSPRSKVLGTLWEQISVPFYSYKLGADHTLFNTNFCAFAAKNPSIIIHTDGGVLSLVQGWKKRLYWQSVTVLTKLSIIRAKHIFTVSNSVADTWVKADSPHKAKMQTIYAGLTADGASAVAPFDDNFFNVVTVGDVYPQKNYNFVAEAFKHVVDKNPDARLQIVGTVYDEFSKNDFFKKIAEYGLQNRVYFHGRKPHKEALSYIKHADVYISASQIEALNLPLIEAQLLNTPIVASNIPVHGEVLGTTVDLFNTETPEDAKTFASKIIAAKGTVQKQENPLLSEFSWPKIAEKILSKLS